MCVTQMSSPPLTPTASELCSTAVCEKWTVTKRDHSDFLSKQKREWQQIEKQAKWRLDQCIRLEEEFPKSGSLFCAISMYSESKNRRNVSSRTNSAVLDSLHGHHVSKSTPAQEMLKSLWILSSKDKGSPTSRKYLSLFWNCFWCLKNERSKDAGNQSLTASCCL